MIQPPKPTDTGESLYKILLRKAIQYAQSDLLPTDDIHKLTRGRALNDSRLVDDYREYLIQHVEVSKVVSQILSIATMELGGRAFSVNYNSIIDNLAKCFPTSPKSIWQDQNSSLAPITDLQREILIANPWVLVMYIISTHAIPTGKTK